MYFWICFSGVFASLVPLEGMLCGPEIPSCFPLLYLKNLTDREFPTHTAEEEEEEYFPSCPQPCHSARLFPGLLTRGGETGA